MLKVVFTGPESSGKTTLARHTAETLGVPWVPEYAREYLESTGGIYMAEDLLRIAEGQQQRIGEAEKLADHLLICDTDLLTIQIWSEYKYQSCHPDILQLLGNNLPDLYLLCLPDIPWEPDPLREHPEQRDQLLEWYRKALQNLNVPMAELGGTHKQRTKTAVSIIKTLLSPTGTQIQF